MDEHKDARSLLSTTREARRSAARFLKRVQDQKRVSDALLARSLATIAETRSFLDGLPPEA